MSNLVAIEFPDEHTAFAVRAVLLLHAHCQTYPRPRETAIRVFPAPHRVDRRGGNQPGHPLFHARPVVRGRHAAVLFPVGAASGSADCADDHRGRQLGVGGRHDEPDVGDSESRGGDLRPHLRASSFFSDSVGTGAIGRGDGSGLNRFTAG